MKGMILALVLQGAAPGGLDAGSLGIGIDVLPEAFSFAASRVSYVPVLRLTRCDAHACRWHLGDGVEMVANLSQTPLEISRVEAELDTPATPDATARYKQACLAIVALFDPDASDARRRSIAAAIATPPAEAPDAAINASGGASFYGAPQRCGATAFSVETGERRQGWPARQ